MITRRPATDDDKSYIKQLFRRVYEDVVVHQFGQWDAEKYDQFLEESWPGHHYEILQLDGEDIGVLWISAEPDHIWLKEIQIAPEHQGKGIGNRLLGEFIEQAKAAGLPLRLRVLKQSRARSLYERLGFQVTGEYKDTHWWMEIS